MFLVLLTLFSIQTVKAYRAGDVVSFSFTRVGCGTGNTGQSTDWYGAPAYLERKIIPPCVNGEVPMISTVKITSPGGCKVNGCGADPSLECVTLKHSSLYTYTNDAKEPVGGRFMNEVCKKCHAEVVKIVEVTNDANGGWRKVEDTLAAKNKCAKYKAGACDTPCPDTLTCPIIEKDCAIEDRNGDGDTEDEYDYKCVEVATIAAPTTAAPIARNALTAAPVVSGGAVLGVVLPELIEPNCCDVVGPPHNFTDCSFKDPRSGKKSEGCCPPGLDCKSESNLYPPTCCLPDEKWSRYLQYSFCDKDECPPADDPARTQTCQKKNSKTCCLPEPQETCGEMGPGFAYCVKQCPVGTPQNKICSGLCCKSNETCTPQIGGMFKCIADSCDTAAGEHMCSGLPGSSAKNIKICCTEEESCLHLPVNGYPYCRVL